MAFNIRDEFLQIPPITRIYTSACVLTTVAVQLDMVSPYTLYFNPKLIIENYQLWRLVTNFTFFGTIGFNFLLNIIFIYRHCRWLEEHSFRNRTADFVVMFIFGGSLMTILAFFIHLVFLGHALTMMLVYVWSRRNHFIRMNIFGVLNFRAPYLPWVLLGFSVLLGNPLVIDLMGIGVGHVYYFLVDVFPRKPGGFKILKTPSILKYLLDPPIVDPNYERMPEDRPGGFDWGLGENVPPPNDDDNNRGENNEGEQ